MPKLKLFAVSLFRHGANLHSYDPRAPFSFYADHGHFVDIIEAESLSRAELIAVDKYFNAERFGGHKPSVRAVEIPQDLIDKYATPPDTRLPLLFR